LPAAARISPIPEHRPHQREGGDRGGIGAQQPRPERKPHRIGQFEERRTLVLGEAPLGANEHGERQGMPVARISRLRERGDRVVHIRRLVAEHEQTLGLELGDHLLEAQRRADVWKRQDAALLRGLDGICAHALEVDARDLRVAHEHRLQSRGAHLHRLLCHVVEASMFEWCEQVMQVERPGLRPRAFDDGKREGAFLAPERAAPFAVAAVEDQHAVAGFQAQHGAEIVGL
jgi:hypothetical protein